MQPSDKYNGAVLAYLGDAVIELLARTEILENGVANAGEANARAKVYVTATAQSAAVERILPGLTDEEVSVYKRGRNAAGANIPRSASVQEYRRATGLEALFAHLYLSGQYDRMKDLFGEAFGTGAKPEKT